MYRDLHVMEPICYRGEQELDRSQVPQLEAVGRLIAASTSVSKQVQSTRRKE